MNAQVQKQILIGGLAGILVAGLVYVVLGGTRSELEAVRAEIQKLDKEVGKGFAIKANYEKLRAEVAQQEKLIEELIKIMPTDADRGDIPYRIKKLSDTAGIDQVSFSTEPPIAKDYYTEWPYKFTFRAGYHTFGQFTSLVSGYEKIINISDFQLKQLPGKTIYPITITCRVSAFVYNPSTKSAPKAAGK